MLIQKNQQMKLQLQETIKLSKEQHLRKIAEDAEKVKIQMKEQQDMLVMQREQELLKNASLKQAIKSEEMLAKDSKLRETAIKKANYRQAL